MNAQEDKAISQEADHKGSYLSVINFNKINTAVYISHD